MSTFSALNVELVKYVCSCGQKLPICRLYLCRHCLKLRCGDCVLHEVDTHYCPNCMEHLPSAEAKLKKNRCSNCFDCPSCGHSLTTRATVVANPDDQNKSTPKKMYYLACGFCRWTTRDAGIEDKPVSSGCWQAQEVPESKRIFSLLENYQQIAQKEKAEKDRKKYVRRRSYMNYSASASLDKYGLMSVAAKKKASLTTATPMSSLKENEESIIRTEKAVPVSEFDALPDEIFTEPINLESVTTIQQRLSSVEFQPTEQKGLYPIQKHLLIRQSLRCKECEHNLSKPEFNPMSIKFKIQLIALYHVPEVRILSPYEFFHKKETKVVLTICNPAAYNTTVSFFAMKPEDNDGFLNAKLELPKGEVPISGRDDAAIYDESSPDQEKFKDDASVVAFRNRNKVGLIFKVTPLSTAGNVQISFWMKHDYRNTTLALTSENQEPQIVWMQHKVLINLGQVKPKK